jgi:hypothetical protein
MQGQKLFAPIIFLNQPIILIRKASVYNRQKFAKWLSNKNLTLIVSKWHVLEITTINITKKEKAMLTILLILAGLLCFAIFYGSVNYFEKI